MHSGFFGTGNAAVQHSLDRMHRERLMAILAWCASGALATGACHRENTYEGHPVVYWYTALRDTSGIVRAHAAELVAQAAPDHPETIARLLDALTTESDSSVHVALAGALADVVTRSGRTTDVVEPLAKLTHDEHETVRIAAVTALARATAASPAATPLPTPTVEAFVTMLRDPSHHIRAAAAEAVGTLATARPDASAVFVDPIARTALEDRIFYVRLAAVEAFVHLPSGDSVALAVYRHALHEDWPDMTTTTLRALARSPRLAAVLVDSISGLLRSDDLVTRELTLKALEAGITTSNRARVSAALDRVRSDPDSSVRAKAREALTGIGGRP